jgi:predicted SprT family Zn-dependent metalloprotease
MTRLVRVVLFGILIGVAAAFLLRASGRFPARREPPPPRTAEQQRTEEIFRANGNQPSDPELAREYQAYNAQYFDNRLPAVRVRWEPRLEEVGPLIADGFRMGGVTNRELILFNPAIREDQEEFRRVLSHEMVHVAVVTEQQSHGPVFQAYLRQLLDKGAFKGILATDAEKQERRRYLDRREKELASEAASLEQTKTAIEQETHAPNPPVESLNARIVSYNAQVRRHNDAVVEFNRDIEEYNQMVSYPDGLDRERLAKREGISAS